MDTNQQMQEKESSSESNGLEQMDMELEKGKLDAKGISKDGPKQQAIIGNVGDAKNTVKQRDENAGGSGEGNQESQSVELTNRLLVCEKMITNIQACNKKHEMLVAESLKSLEIKMNTVLLNQGKILAYIAPEDKMFEPANMPNILLDNEKDLSNFEEFLKTPSNFKSFVSYVRQMTIDQTDEKESAAHILRKMFTNKFARCINWDGGHRKITFSKTYINKAICISQLKNFPQGKLIKTKTKIQRWFNTSNQRQLEGRRSKAEHSEMGNEDCISPCVIDEGDKEQED
ncbi:uncharacterized protein LOC124159447 [Ischnura elegans]|uniref:uncharacterized protein LOC124159447 n=1 Tax=Ischnura elegans TaxID=197161 RepID=UPI001ED86F0D|nr:uncharacterized protein LOC124159447 [Ischnura elegans]